MLSHEDVTSIFLSFHKKMKNSRVDFLLNLIIIVHFKKFKDVSIIIYSILSGRLTVAASSNNQSHCMLFSKYILINGILRLLK